MCVGWWWWGGVGGEPTLWWEENKPDETYDHPQVATDPFSLRRFFRRIYVLN